MMMTIREAEEWMLSQFPVRPASDDPQLAAAFLAIFERSPDEGEDAWLVLADGIAQMAG
jgi:hypothetical protein